MSVCLSWRVSLKPLSLLRKAGFLFNDEEYQEHVGTTR